MNNLRQITAILYRLKRNYGGEVKLRNRLYSDVDRKTGKLDVNYDTITIRKAIILPAKAVPSFVYDLAYTAAGRNFTYGGLFGSHTRNVIVDGVDLIEDFLVKEKTEVLFEQSIHVLKDFRPTATNLSFLLTVTTLSSLEKVDE
jgi:hypothetical protein